MFLLVQFVVFVFASAVEICRTNTIIPSVIRIRFWTTSKNVANLNGKQIIEEFRLPYHVQEVI